MLQAVYRRFNAEEQRRADDPALAHELTAAARAALARRAELPPTCYGTQATMANLHLWNNELHYEGHAHCKKLIVLIMSPFWLIIRTMS